MTIYLIIVILVIIRYYQLYVKRKKYKLGLLIS